MKAAVVASALFAFLTGCATPPAPPTRITILHTNDHHGRFWKSGDGEYGLAARKTLIDAVRAEVRAQGGYTLLLDGGDVNSGVPESDMQDAEPDFRGMSAIGYDAMVVGNHEFDKSLPVQQKQREAWSTFPWLSANVYRNGSRMFEPYRLFRLGPVRVAVLGLTTDDTGRMLAGERFPGVELKSPAGEAAHLVPLLRRQADVVVAATHMGHYADGKHGVNAPGDVELARTVGGIDLIVGGHSHNTVCMVGDNRRNDAYQPGAACVPDRQNGTWIVQAGEWGKYVGRADFEYRAGEFRLVRYALLPVSLRRGEPIAEDARVEQLLRPYQERGAASLQATVGRSEGKFDGERASVRFQPTNLGALVTAAMLERTGADLAVVSSGGIRDSLPEGVLRYRDVLKVQPFGNRIVVVTMSGAELQAYLQAIARMTPGSGAFPQTSGLRMTIEGGRAEDMQVQGRGIEPDKRYRLALSSFVARGGDGYPDLSRHPGFADTGLVDAAVLGDFIARRGVIRAGEFAATDSIVRR